MIYKAVKYILENDADFSSAIGTDSDGNIKLYPIYPTKEVSLPFATYNIVDQVGNPTKDAPSSVDDLNLRISIYDLDFDVLEGIATKARTALDNEKDGGTYNGVKIATIDFDRMRDGFVEIMSNRGALLIELDFRVWSEE